METITTDTVLLVELIRDGIHICLGRHGLMERCIEYTYLRQTRHQLLHRIHTFQIGRVVKWSQIRTLLESLQYLIGENNRLVELLTTMHHAVTDGIDLIETLDHTDLRIGQQREDELHALRMFGDVVHNLFLLTISQLHLHKGAIETYTLSATTGHHTLIVHIVQGVLDRGRTTV